LEAGNEILIVSKPHIECIGEICRRFIDYREQILFRFSIGSVNDRILHLWEPGAPRFYDRLTSLRVACEEGFATSVSCEPLLDSPNVAELFHTLWPYVTDTIWIGKMNCIGQRVIPGTDPKLIAAGEAGQTDEAVLRVHDELKNERIVRWKDSYRDTLRRLGVGLAGQGE
jgi:hypothetical protein